MHVSSSRDERGCWEDGGREMGPGLFLRSLLLACHLTLCTHEHVHTKIQKNEYISINSQSFMYQATNSKREGDSSEERDKIRNFTISLPFLVDVSSSADIQFSFK